MRTAEAPGEAIETACVRAGPRTPSVARPLTAPIVPASVYAFDSIESLTDVCEGREHGFLYARGAHPNQVELETLVARLEGAAAGLACASGMGALTAALMAAVRPGARIVAAHELYGRTATLIQGPLAALGVRPDFVDLTDSGSAERALSRPAAAVIVESLSNPLLTIPDMERAAALAHAAGALLIVDNTLATPYHCRPLDLGADVVVHSGSKYLGGHSDTLCGVLAGEAEFVARARDLMVTLGSPAAPFDCWLTARGLKTLALRMARASANAAEIAHILAGWEQGIERVIYPGLPSHPQHARARAQLRRGFGAMIALELRGGRPAVSAFVRALREIVLAPSFGDVSTTVAYPAAMQEGEPDQGRGDVSRREGLVRLSIGIEDPQDLIVDLERGLTAIG